MKQAFLMRARCSTAWMRFAIRLAIIPALSAMVALPALSQNTEIEAQVNAGEFTLAIRGASELDQQSADTALGSISVHQHNAGASDAAFQTVAAIRGDTSRSQTLAAMSSFSNPQIDADTFGGGSFGSGSRGSAPVGGGVPGGGIGQPPGGNAGGVTINDFQPLMELIRQTIAPDTWSDANGEGTLTAYPNGVFVDGRGLMQRLKTSDTPALAELQNSARNDSGNRLWKIPADMRKVSLNRLEKAAQIAAAQGLLPDESMMHLAGIYEIKYLAYLPETSDIIIAGPAGPVEQDVDGRLLNRDTGKPVLLLDDLVVCLRNAFEDNGTFGCSINPRPDNLKQTQEYVQQATTTGSRWRDGLRDALGRQDIEVFGIDPRTHAGYVLVEADYRMKLVGMGLEPTIASVPSYLDRVNIDADGNLPPMDIVRWWFTLNYNDVTASENREIFGFTGSGVKVLSESELLDNAGRRIHLGQAFGPTRDFAEDFTEHFDEMATTYPVYRQLKNVFDLAIVSSLIEGQGLADRAQWNLTYFGSDDSSGRTYQPGLRDTPLEVESVMNHRVIRQRKEGKTLRHTLVGVSGGVICTTSEVTDESKLRTDENLVVQQQASQPDAADVPQDSLVWWWD